MVGDNFSWFDIFPKIFLSDHVLEDAPLKQTKEFLDANGIDIAVRATDGGAGIDDQFHKVPFRGGMIRFVPRTEGLRAAGGVA